MFALQALAVFVIAVVFGLGSAWLAIEREIAFESVRVGAWTAWPRAAEADVDPYVRAGVATTGELPLSISEGLAFSARNDSDGVPLEGRCEYRLTGRMPPARWWTIAVYDDDDFTLIANPADRYGFDSTEVLRRPDGAVELVVAPAARAGNWLPSAAAVRRLRLTLRLYDTPLSIGGAAAEADLPTIERGSCQ